MSARPATSIRCGELVRAGEALDRARQVAVGVLVAGQPADQRDERDRTTALKKLDSGGLRRGRDLEHDDPPAAAARRASSPRSPRSRSEKLRAPKPTVDGGEARRPRRAARARCPIPSSSAGAFCRARASISSEKSEPMTSPPGPTRAASSSARSPVPVATSSTLSPAPTSARSAARRAPVVVQPGRHHRVHDVVDAGDAIEHRPHLRLFERAARRPGRARHRRGGRLLQLGEELSHLLELLRRVLRQALERGHRRRRVDQRPLDRRRGQPRADLGQVGAGAVVAVLADLVAGQAARLRDDLPARARTPRPPPGPARRCCVGGSISTSDRRAGVRRRGRSGSPSRRSSGCPPSSRSAGARGGARGCGRRTAAGTAGSCRSSGCRSSPAGRARAA